MNTDQFLSAIRTALKIIGTILATHGANQAAGIVNSEDVIGLVLLVASIWWSHRSNATDTTKPPTPAPPIAPLLLLIPALLMPAIFTGCSSAPTVAYQTEGVVITTVDSAMKAWADYVKAGNATQSQVDQVKAIYEKYFLAQQVAKSALKDYVAAQTDTTQSAWQQAAAAAMNAQGAVIDLVKSFLPKPSL